VTVSCTSFVWNWLNDLLMLVSYSVESGSPGVESAGTKGIDCQSWSQIEGAMQQKFPVPQK